MKTISTRIRVLIATAAVGALATFGYAGQGIQYWKTLGSESDFKQLKPGADVVYVCNMCKTLTNIPIKSQEHALTLCKEDSSMTCPSCKKTSKVVIKRARNDAPTHTEVTYVDDKGKECGFMAIHEEKQ